MTEIDKRRREGEGSKVGGSRAVIAVVQTPLMGEEEVAVSCGELELLAATLGVEVVGQVLQRRQRPSRATYFGKGKSEELAQVVQELEATLVLVDDSLTARQLHSLELAVEVEVWDRPGVILEIFERRAQTREARQQVEIARLEYELPRVRERAVKLDRQVGGGGRGERGHTHTELEKQRIRDRLIVLKRELAEMHTRGDAQRERRSRHFQVALVGYTNAGKSALMRGLTESEVLVEDQLFATLGTTVRQLEPPMTPAILVSDTVGFIKNLPHELVASFRSTLEEARQSDLIAHVVDASDSDKEDQIRVTKHTLEELGAQDLPRLLIFNKIDRLDVEAQEELARKYPGALLISAFEQADLKMLRERFAQIQERSFDQESFLIPFEKGWLLGEIHEQARVVAEEHIQHGTLLIVRGQSYLLDRWRAELGPYASVENVDEALEMAARHGLELLADEQAVDESGLDFKVIHATDEDEVGWILRIPRRCELLVASRLEERILRLVGPRLPVEVPRWRLHTPHLIAYRSLGGVPGWTVLESGELQWNMLDPSAPAQEFFDSTARFLLALQAIPKEEVAAVGAPVRTMDEIRRGRVQMMEEMIPVLEPEPSVIIRWRQWLEDEESWPRHSALIHGDLHPGHMLLKPDGSVVGVLDWTEAAVGDPGRDLSVFFGCFGHAGLERMLGSFEAAGGRLWPGVASYIEELWAFYPVVVAEWAVRTGHEGALEHARAHLAAVEVHK